MQENSEKQFQEWAIVELMGHQRMAGLVSEHHVAGKGFLRVDVYEKKGESVTFTRFVNPDSVYAINPVTKEIALEMGSDSVKPVTRYDISNLLPEHKLTVPVSHEDDPHFF